MVDLTGTILADPGLDARLRSTTSTMAATMQTSSSLMFILEMITEIIKLSIFGFFRICQMVKTRKRVREEKEERETSFANGSNHQPQALIPMDVIVRFHHKNVNM